VPLTLAATVADADSVPLAISTAGAGSATGCGLEQQHTFTWSFLAPAGLSPIGPLDVPSATFTPASPVPHTVELRALEPATGVEAVAQWTFGVVP
jgi:hypothetical protein